MLPFNEEQIAAIRANLAEPNRAPRDLAIFETWLHNCLRVSDFRLLTVGDVQGTNGAIRSRIVTAQRKVSKAKRCQPVEVDVPQRARDALARMIASEGKTAKDFLFTHSRRPHGEPLCRKQLARLVKRWASEIGMDTHRIAAHTMRRTRPTIAIRKGLATLVHVRHWLGHKDIAVTTGYVGIEAEDALQVSAQCAL
jgi:site-specific recombinase XerD